MPGEDLHPGGEHQCGRRRGAAGAAEGAAGGLEKKMREAVAELGYRPFWDLENDFSNT